MNKNDRQQAVIARLTEENRSLKALLSERPYTGYVIGGPERTGDIAVDWDGVVHTNLDAGLTELENCRAAGWWDWNLYGLTQVSVPAEETDTEVRP